MQSENKCRIINESSKATHKKIVGVDDVEGPPVPMPKVGVDDVEGPPVPMPNTEVKLDSAENTRMVTSREDRKVPTSKAAAQ